MIGSREYLFPRIRNIISPTLSAVLFRFERFYEDFGWVDMKFDPATGEDRKSVV